MYYYLYVFLFYFFLVFVNEFSGLFYLFVFGDFDDVELFEFDEFFVKEVLLSSVLLISL